MKTSHILRIAELAEKLSEQGGKSLPEVFAKEFGCNEWDRNFATALGEIQETLKIVRQEIRDAPLSERSRSLFQGAISEVGAALTPPTFVSKNTNHLRGLKEKVNILFMAADVLPKVEDRLPSWLAEQDLSGKIDQIINEIEEGDFDVGLKALLIEHMQLVRFAITNYERLGRRAVIRMFGAATADLARTEQSNTASSREAKNTLKKVRSVISAIGGALIFAGASLGGANAILVEGKELLETLHLLGPSQGSGEEGPKTGGEANKAGGSAEERDAPDEGGKLEEDDGIGARGL